MNIDERWMRWTLLEAGTKTASKVLQKVVGNVSVTFAHTFLATLVIGLVQTITGLVVTRAKKIALWPDRESVIGACLFGLFAVLSTVMGFGAFYYGGDMGVNTFIITLSIVPGALIDWCFFGKRLVVREWVGVGVAVLAGYTILGWPSLQELTQLPLWVWLSVGTMFTVAINQGITQKVKKIDPFVKNFWGGLTTVVLCLTAIIVLGKGSTLTDFSGTAKKLWGVSAVIGVIVVGMWAFNLLSYKGGASIALKKLVMNGTYLTTAMVCGVLFFGEPVNLEKGAGVVLYLAAFVLMDKNTWEFVSRPRAVTANAATS